MSTFNIRIERHRFEIITRCHCNYPFYAHKDFRNGKWYYRSAVNGRIGLRICPACEKPIENGNGQEENQ